MFIYKIKNCKIKNLKLKRKAFTLLELLIVIGITAVLSAVGVGFYVNQQKTKILDNTAQEIANYLRYAQQKSIAQEQGLQWGVHFDNPTSGSDFYALYTGTTYSSPIETKYLPAGIEFQTPTSGNSVNVSFNKLTGLNSSGAEQEIIIRLTSNQVARVIRTMSNGLVVVSEGEKGYWKFDEGSGTTAYDSTIYKNNGILTCIGTGCSNPTWQSSSNCISGNCLSFTGTTGSSGPGSYVQVANVPSITAGTFEAWVYPTAVSNDQMFLGNQSATANYFRILSSKPFISFNIGGTQKTLSGSTVLQNNKWYHLVATYDGSIIKLYVNGVQEPTTLSYSGTLTFPTSTINIGIWITSDIRPFNGLIDQVRIYNRALSPAEIQQHYNSRS